MDGRSFADILADALSQHKFSRSAAAEALGINRTTLYRWLNGTSRPSVEQRAGLAKLPRALGMSLAETERFLSETAATLGFQLRRASVAAPPPLPHRVHCGSDDLPPFAGRAAELAELQQHVLAGHAVLITGMGGMGKTRLAQELLRACAGEFHHGCEFLTLTADEDGARVLRHVAHLLGVNLRPEDVTSENRRLALGRLREQLEGIGLLFLVDDVANAGQVRDLAQGLRAVTWVFTARRVGLRQIGVHPLHLRLPGAAEAAAIFRAHLPVTPVPDRDDDRLVGRVVAKVGGLPYALRLAAAVVGNDQVATLAELDAWLDAGGLARAGSPTRKLERLFDSMLGSLPPPARRTLLLCGAFPTPTIRLSAAQAVGEAAGARPTPDDWATLEDYSLAEFPDHANVTLHARLHAHAGKRLAAEPYAPAVREGFVAHYLALAESVSLGIAETERDYRPLIGEESSLLAAAESLRAAGDWSRVRRIWPAISGYLWDMGERRAYEAFDSRCLEAAFALGDELWAAGLRSELGYAALERGDAEAAEALFHQAQTTYDTTPDRPLDRARLRRYRSQAALAVGQSDRALALLAEAERLLADAAGAENETLAHMLLHSARMTVHHARGELAAAAAAGSETERLYARLDSARNRQQYGEFRVELGDVLLQLDRAEAATAQWASYLDSRAGLPHTPSHAEAQLRLAWLAARAGAMERAAEFAAAAAGTFRVHGQLARSARAEAFMAVLAAGEAPPPFDALMK